jgi:hypothetical protein
MYEQKELFERDRSPRDMPLIRLPMGVVYLTFSFLFAMLGFLVYLLWDFGIAGRVILFLALVLVLVHFAVFMARALFDAYWPRR